MLIFRNCDIFIANFKFKRLSSVGVWPVDPSIQAFSPSEQKSATFYSGGEAFHQGVQEYVGQSALSEPCRTSNFRHVNNQLNTQNGTTFTVA